MDDVTDQINDFEDLDEMFDRGDIIRLDFEDRIYNTRGEVVGCDGVSLDVAPHGQLVQSREHFLIEVIELFMIEGGDDIHANGLTVNGYIEEMGKVSQLWDCDY